MITRVLLELIWECYFLKLEGKSSKLTQNWISIVNVLDAHFDVFNTEIHFNLLYAQKLVPADIMCSCPKVNFSSNTL